MWHIHEEREKFLLLVKLISIPVRTTHLEAFFFFFTCADRRGRKKIEVGEHV